MVLIINGTVPNTVNKSLGNEVWNAGTWLRTSSTAGDPLGDTQGQRESCAARAASPRREGTGFNLRPRCPSAPHGMGRSFPSGTRFSHLQNGLRERPRRPGARGHSVPHCWHSLTLGEVSGVLLAVGSVGAETCLLCSQQLPGAWQSAGLQ